MTRDKDFKDHVRATAARTGKSYVKARAELRGEGEPRPRAKPATPHTAARVVDGDLSAEDVCLFHERGVVLRFPAAFPRRAALHIQELLWADVEARLGVDRADPATWDRDGVPKRAWGPTRGVIEPVEAVRNANLGRVDDLLGQLLGQTRWNHQRAWGNGVLVTPPFAPNREWTLSDLEWHWDGSPAPGACYFVLFSDVEACGGATLVLEGSGRAVTRWIDQLDVDDRERLYARWIDSEPFLRKLNGEDPEVDDPSGLLGVHTLLAGDELRVVELAGDAGDVFVLDSNSLHAAPRRTGATTRFQVREFLSFPDAPKWRGPSAIRRERRQTRKPTETRPIGR